MGMQQPKQFPAPMQYGAMPAGNNLLAQNGLPSQNTTGVVPLVPDTPPMPTVTAPNATPDPTKRTGGAGGYFGGGGGNRGGGYLGMIGSGSWSRE